MEFPLDKVYAVCVAGEWISITRGSFKALDSGAAFTADLGAEGHLVAPYANLQAVKWADQLRDGTNLAVTARVESTATHDCAQYEARYGRPCPCTTTAASEEDGDVVPAALLDVLRRWSGGDAAPHPDGLTRAAIGELVDASAARVHIALKQLLDDGTVERVPSRTDKRVQLYRLARPARVITLARKPT